MRLWRRPLPVELPESIVRAAGSRLLAELLYRRGFRSEDAIATFLTGSIDLDAPGLPDLEQGVARLAEAVRTGERICVYGDYDTDGVTSTALLVDLLRSLGAEAAYCIPNRFRDGYGMNTRVVEALAAEGTSLILTCDCGIRNLDEVAAATALGMEVIVTDHHELGPALPAAHAVINPKRLPEGDPCRMLPGVGTAYLVARQLLRTLDRDPGAADRWLDLVAVGIIADVVPLHGANRELARRGLSRLQTSPCNGLQALVNAAALDGHLTEEDVAFQVVPRLNSAGRLADAALGVRLLLSRDPDEAHSLALELDQLNQERKKLTASVIEAASREVSEGTGAILLYHAEWHEGVLGIAAGKLAEQCRVPVLLMARKHGGNVLVGSARAPEGFALHEALQACGDHLLKHGGHAAAAGFSLLEDRLPAFRAAIQEEVRRRTRPGAAVPMQEADMELPLSRVDRALYDDLRRAAPFGAANPAPVFFSECAALLSSRPIGPGEKHLRLIFRDGERSFTGLWWGAGTVKLEPGGVALYYRLGLNRWSGEEMLQVVVEHLGPGVQPTAATAVTRPPRPELVDHRGQPFPSGYPEALIFAEGEAPNHPDGAVGRYRLRPVADLVLLSPPPSPRLLDEAVAITGARRLILAWPTDAPPDEDRFLPGLMRTLVRETRQRPYVSISRLAVATAELESVVRLGILALVESDLAAIEEEGADVVRLRRRADGRGIKESEPLRQMRRLISESRAFRRFLRTASLQAIEQVIR